MPTREASSQERALAEAHDEYVAGIRQRYAFLLAALLVALNDAHSEYQIHGAIQEFIAGLGELTRFAAAEAAETLPAALGQIYGGLGAAVDNLENRPGGTPRKD